MERSRKKILPVFETILRMLNTAKVDLENKVIVELKSVASDQYVHKKQLLTYLRLAKKPLGLLINFNESILKNGITRIINSPLS